MNSRFENLHPDDLIIDLNLQMREGGIDQKWATELAEHLDDGGEFDDPPVAFRNPSGGKPVLARGFHRVWAAKTCNGGAGRAIRVEVRTGSRRDAWVSALGDNATHRSKPLRQADVRKKILAAKADRELAGYTDRKLAELIGCSGSYLSRVCQAMGRQKDESKSRPQAGAATSGDTDGRGRRGGRGDFGDGWRQDQGHGGGEGGQPGRRPGDDDRGDTGRVDAVERDRLGRPVPHHLRPAAKSGRELNGIAGRLRGCLKDLRKLSDKHGPLGSFLARWPGLEELLEEAEHRCRREVCWCVCPACDGDGDAEQCPTCGGKGWCSYQEYLDFPEADGDLPSLKEIAGSFKPGDAWEGDESDFERPPPVERPFVPPGPGLDARGEPVPPHLRDIFSDSWLLEAAAQVRRVAKQARSARQYNPWIKPVVPDDLERCADDMAGARLYAVCPDCKGKGCGDCLMVGGRPADEKHELPPARR